GGVGSQPEPGAPPPGPAVPCTTSVDEPLMAAARCSPSQVFAVPGTPRRSSARSVASVANAVSTKAREPKYFGSTTVPSGSSPPSTYSATAHGESRQLGGC